MRWTAAQKIPVFLLDWHQRSSEAARLTFLDPVGTRLDLIPVSGPEAPESVRDAGVSVHFAREPSDALLRLPGHRVVWIPMFGRKHNESTWQKTGSPADLRVVAYSEVTARKAASSGIPFERVKYFEDPSLAAPAPSFSDVRVFYWNRMGLVSERFLKALCSTVGATELLYRNRPDGHRFDHCATSLPGKLGSTTVTPVDVQTREDYLAALGRANVFLAPRTSEGIGCGFIEALSRGCFVLGHPATTFTEYVSHMRSGFVLRPRTGVGQFTARVTHGAAGHPRLGRLAADKAIPWLSYRNQDWAALAGADLDAIGRRARQESEEGHQAWLASLPGLLDFIAG